MSGHIRKLGRSRYQARWIDPTGRECSKVLTRKFDAERHLVSVQHAILSGSYLDPRAASVRVGEMAEQWLAGKVNLKPSTRSLYRILIDSHIVPSFGAVPVGRVMFSDVQSWIASKVADGVGASHVRDMYGVLSSILALAVRERRISSNPATGVDLPRRVDKPRLYLNPVQLHQLAEQAATLPAGRPRRATDKAFRQYRLVVLLLGYCGLRWGEMAALKVKRVDLLNRRLTVAEAVTEVRGELVWGTPKTHVARALTLPPFLADLLAQHVAGKSPDDLVFTAPDGGVLRNRNARRAWFTRAAASIGVPDLVPHDLRHTAASIAISGGANPKMVQRMLGHASAVMTMDRYADLFPEDMDSLSQTQEKVAQAAALAVKNQDD